MFKVFEDIDLKKKRIPGHVMHREFDYILSSVFSSVKNEALGIKCSIIKNAMGHIIYTQKWQQYDKGLKNSWVLIFFSLRSPLPNGTILIHGLFLSVLFLCALLPVSSFTAPSPVPWCFCLRPHGHELNLLKP